jgi:hydroxymethylpyrimidine/phosphomethylpyrimidine kinase
MAPEWLEGPVSAGVGDPHGTGCVLSAAICAGLALGWPLEEACRTGKTFTAAAIRAAVRVGGGALVLRPGPWRDPAK